MKTFPVLLLLLVAVMATTGCKKYLAVNDNPNSQTSVTEGLQLAPIEESVSGFVASGGASVYVNYWLQNITLNQPVPNEVTYVVTNSSFDTYWYYFYVTCLNNLKILNGQATANNNSMYAGIAKTLTAYTLGSTTDLWGDVPYSKGLSGISNVTPAYDSQEQIYTTIQLLLDSAVNDLTKASGTAPGTDDYYYGGDMSKWLKLTYSLKARYFMHLTKAPGYDAVKQSTQALAALENGMTDYTDDCFFPYSGTQTSSAPWYWNFYNTSTVIYASQYVDSLKARNDPRLSLLVAPAQNTGLYTGSVIGSGFNNLQDYSVSGSFYGNANSNGYVFNADEALFLKAEATYRTAGSAAAMPIYRNAITDNMLKLGLDTASSAVQAYLTKRGTLTDANALELIIEEKDVANYLSLENYTDWRRTGYPPIAVISNANGAPASVTEIPRRFLYPESEITSNPQSVQGAKLTDRVWWDKK